MSYPIKILTQSAPQNDSLNLSFVKYVNVVAKEWPKVVIKCPFMSCKFPFFFLTYLNIKENNQNRDSCCSFDSIKILSCWALQNDSHNLSFVKAINVVGKKMARNTFKKPNSQLSAFRFETEFSYLNFQCYGAA